MNDMRIMLIDLMNISHKAWPFIRNSPMTDIQLDIQLAPYAHHTAGVETFNFS